MNAAPMAACTNDHLFLCPRALCRAHFHVLELWDSEQCDASDTSPPLIFATINANDARAAANESIAGIIPNTEPAAAFSVPAPPDRMFPEFYLLARYTTNHTGCYIQSRTSPEYPRCCGLLREFRFPYAIASGSEHVGALQCNDNVVTNSCTNWPLLGPGERRHELG